MKVRKAVIPAAGLGTRMLPATKSIPKEMLPIVDKPAIEYIVDEAVASGVEDILIITNRGKCAMEDYFDYAPEIEYSLKMSKKDEEYDLVRGLANKANIVFVRQKETKGLGHAVWRAKSFVGNEPFAVLLGDDIMVSDEPVTKQLITAAIEHGASSVGAQLVDSKVIGKYCSLKVDLIKDNVFHVTDAIEKPTPDQVFSNYAILGRYVLMPKIFEILENTPPGFGGEIQITDGLNTLCKVDKMVAVDFVARRYDTGNLKGYLETILDFAMKDDRVNTWLKEYMKEKVK